MAIAFKHGFSGVGISWFYMVCRQSLQNRHINVWQKTNVERIMEMGTAPLLNFCIELFER
jgi:hypothetical protein